MRPESKLVGAEAADRPLLERLIARDHAIVGAAITAAAVLAWLWLAAPPGMAGIDGGMAMAMPAEPAAWAPDYLLAAFLMWALMMVAMMLPSAAPMILLYSRFARRSGLARPRAYSAAFVLAYLGIWTIFSIAATLAQALSVSAGWIQPMTLAVGNGRVAGGLLVLAGLYQLSPLKRACLDQCRSPLSFIMRLSRPGLIGAARIGVAHGLYCLGCCWALMALLFVGGVMNLAWIAALAALVLLEKTASASLRVSRLISWALIALGMVGLVRPDLLI